MTTSIDPQKCKYFRSRSLCPKRDNKALIDLDHLCGPPGTLVPSDIFEKAKAVCSGCDQFEPLSPTR